MPGFLQILQRLTHPTHPMHPQACSPSWGLVCTSALAAGKCTRGPRIFASTWKWAAEWSPARRTSHASSARIARELRPASSSTCSPFTTSSNPFAMKPPFGQWMFAKKKFIYNFFYFVIFAVESGRENLYKNVIKKFATFKYFFFFFY